MSVPEKTTVPGARAQLVRTDVSKPRVAFLTNHPAPYTSRTLQKVQQRGHVDLQVISLLEKDRGHSFGEVESPGYPLLFLDRNGLDGARKRSLISSVLAPVARRSYDVIMIPGVASRASQAVLLCSMALGRSFVYCADTVFRPYGSAMRDRMRSLRDRRIMKFAGAVLVPGRASRQYFEAQGMPATRVFEGLYNLDPAEVGGAFCGAVTARVSLRARHAIPASGFVFLMVANMTPNRCHKVLLDAFRRLPEGLSASLVLIGTGPKQSEIETLCRSDAFRNVRLIGPVPFRALAGWYAAADAYVHSGYEPYSTALQFAAIVGLPIVTTVGVGAAADYLEPEYASLLSPVKDAERLAENMIRVATDRELAGRLRQTVRHLATGRTADWAADQFEQAATVAFKSRRRWPCFSC